MSKVNDAIQFRLGLRAGDWVVVRSAEEILTTLDERGCLEALPFQPEMFAFCGRRMRVAKSAHKTCDNIRKTGGRWMKNAVHLEGSRCDGALHGGCQADCVFFWKEAWLRRATASDLASPAPAGVAATNGRTAHTVNGTNRLVQLQPKRCTTELVHQAVRAPGDSDEDPTWVCQTTALYDATTLAHWWDIRQYIRDVTSGNHSAGHMIRLLLAAMYRKFVQVGPGYTLKIRFYNWVQRHRGGKPYPAVSARVPDGQRTPTEILDLQPGQWVEVRSTDEIMDTLAKHGMNRGMRYTNEMAKYSGGRYRVQMRVDRLINEVTGKMMIMKNPCIQLEDVYCRAMCTTKRLGCPRASNTYWREIWLRPIEHEDGVPCEVGAGAAGHDE